MALKPPLNVYTGPGTFPQVPMLRTRIALELRDLPKHDKVWGAAYWQMPDGTSRVVTLWGKRFGTWRETLHACPTHEAGRVKYHWLIASKYQYASMTPGAELTLKIHAQLEAYGNTLLTLEATEKPQIDVEDCTVCSGSQIIPTVKQARAMFCIECWVPLAEHDGNHPHALALTHCQGFLKS